ncbi:polysaccharide deacetylase family protein [Syntrophomonas erecta]
MKIYYFSKQWLLGGVAILLLIGSFLGFSLLYFSGSGIASQMREPIYQGNTGKKMVAITVNVDWGEEYLPEMLKEFKKNNARVTFYVTGRWAENNQEMLKHMAKEGHSIQNHGYQHVHFNSLSPEEAHKQIKKAEQVIKEITGKKPTFFAPPYGEHNKRLMTVVSDLGYNLTMWSVDTIDWQRPAPETIIKRVGNKVHNDAIILMHPTEPTVKALPGMLSSLREEGYKMVTIDKIVLSGEKKKAHDEGN